MKNFVIVGTQRTGSGMLEDVINAFPGVLSGWEWTQRSNYFRKLRIAQEGLRGEFDGLNEPDQSFMRANYSKELHWLGFRRLFSCSNKWLVHPRFSPLLHIDRFNAHKAWLQANPQIHVFHIMRRNNVDWVNSKYLSRSSNAYQGQKYAEDEKIKIPVRAALKRIEAKMWLDESLRTLKSTNPYLEIDYDICSSNRSLVAKSVAEFLGVPLEGSSAGQLNEGRKKQASKSAASYIENYEKLVTAVNDAGMLRDASVPMLTHKMALNSDKA